MKYEQLYLKAGVRSKAHLSHPKLLGVEHLVLPHNAVIHHYPHTAALSGPEPVDPLFVGIVETSTVIMIDHQEQLATKEGRPRPIAGQSKKMIHRYQRLYRRFRPMRRMETALRDDKIAITINYSLLTHIYRYTRSALSGYQQWINLYNTIFDRFRTMAKVSSRPHFIECRLPETIPTLEKLHAFERKINRQTVDEIGDGTSLWIASIFNWLGERKSDDTQLMPNLTDDEIGKLNLVWVVSGKASILNLEQLATLRDDSTVEAQKAFLRYIDYLVDQRAVVVEKTNVTEVKGGKIEDPIRTKAVGLKDNILKQAEELAEDGNISAAEYRRLVKLANSHEEIENPFGAGKVVDLAKGAKNAAKIKIDDQLTSIDSVFDKSMEKSSLKSFDSKYIEEVMQADMAAMVLTLQKAGIAITDYKVDEIQDAASNFYVYTVKMTPIDGKASTVSFQIPKVRADGTFMANGVKSRMDKQRADMPIRKVRPDRVALTSYYNKVFVDRDQRAVYNLGRWVTNQLITLADDKEGPVETLSVNNVFDHEIRTPRIYSAIAQRIDLIRTSKYELNFDYHARAKYADEAEIKKLERKGAVVCGKGAKGGVVTVDENDVFYRHDKDKMEVIGDINTVLDGSLSNPPVEIATMKIMGKSAPVGAVLAYRYGLKSLLVKLGVKYQTVPRGTRVQIDDDQFAITFADETLILNRGDREAMLLVGGFRMMKKTIKQYSIHEFDKPDIYLNALEEVGLTVRHIREIDNLFDMFVDPITEDLLEEMDEPQTFDGLLRRATQLLVTDEHPRETDMAYMRIRGYERLPGLVYSELSKSVRAYKGKPFTANSKIELNPRAVWLGALQDPSLAIVEDINPIHNLKERERVTYSGLGGRNAQSMVKRSREFHPNDQGVISEATLDSGKVAINTYTTADPNFTSLRGTTRRLDQGGDGLAKQVSTTALLLPAADREDPKRANFANIQYSHTVPTVGGSVQPLRTGYEQIVAHRVDDLYAVAAEQDGKVIKVTEGVAVFKYKDGAEKRVQLGRRFGKVSGVHIPHNVVCDLAVGKSFKKGDIITFNEGFFVRDFFNKTQVSMKSGFLVRTALLESPDTLEDSTAISEHTSELLGTRTTAVRNVTVDFTQTLHNLVQSGDALDNESILCTIEDAVTADSTLFDDDTLDTLTTLSANTPRAKNSGIVERIEVTYYGDRDDMSPDLKRLVNRFDKERAKEVEELDNGAAKYGEVLEAVMVDGNRIPRNTAVFKIFITKLVGAGVGDKTVTANQLKATVGRVMTGVNQTESGEDIDAIFGYQSISARIVLSPEIAGTTNTIMRKLGEKMSDIYFGDA